MKIGFVFECQYEGPDELVYTYVAKELCRHFEILQENISPLGNKHAVINDSALDVVTMFANGCDYVFIMWDRMPKWKHGTPYFGSILFLVGEEEYFIKCTI